MHVSDDVSGLRLYQAVARYRLLGYQGKILAAVFLGIHLPLITLALWVALDRTADWSVWLQTLAVALAATLVGTGLTLWVLHHLLRPVTLTSQALRRFRDTRERLSLPVHYTDQVGTLMADTHETLAHLEQALHALEFVDAATGLPNRKRFARELQQRIAQGEVFAVAVVRFSNLSRIAGTMDVERAESAARAVALRLGAMPAFALALSRIGPSKFGCVLLPVAGDATPWASAAARLRAALDACCDEILIGEFAFKPVLQGGLSAYPDDGADAEQLIDAAVHAASLAQAGDPVVQHSAKARQASLEHFRLEQDLRRALEREEFVLHYQPVFDLAAGRAVGAEALLRWQHPERGLLLPGAFIGAAEASGLIEPIGLWVLRQACAQVRDWNGQGLAGLRMAINVSARQFLNPLLKDQVLAAIARCNLSPAQLEIELTETAAMADHAHTHRVFTALRDAGVGISIDDFGTGYASMSYLRKLPFDKLKIDREFVTDVHQTRPSQAICSALIALARGLGLRVLAEGAETASEVNHLAQQGCDLFQGYFFARPVPAADFAQAMAMPVGLAEPARPAGLRVSRRAATGA
ncbi:bifunctional diguanylate cyclase/phosphodiesterase [Pseudorhodoferax sp. Leaf267]|uniref:putative bifunctional diguanylate cyclase/phosphodiesterase n=1 Tax=Pseudorhodoferax sp. Leaf267 TaxID=1736316 RepID=UPI00138F8AC1|nr:bifunctional diguanylate cyclase/phosphodiesterase [Pseudorhodoferax sp. Leaf267]